MRWTQYVHFSITPRLRTVTSGLYKQLELRNVPLRVLEEIETPHLVRAVVRAIARADAAVVGHLIDAFRAVRRGFDRTDGVRTGRSRSAGTASARK